jgi:hypothetical protein
MAHYKCILSDYLHVRSLSDQRAEAALGVATA